jgi:hypothetical protein
MWRRGGGLVVGSGGRFNVSVTGVEGSQEEGKQKGMPLPEGEEGGGGDAARCGGAWPAGRQLQLVWRWERREVGPAWSIGPRLLGKKECWSENGQKNRNLDYEF